MACNLLAHRQAPLFLGAGFDAVRNLVLTGVGDPWDFVAFNTASVDLNAQGSALGQLDHLVLVHGDATACSVHGLVALYGHLQFVLFLGSAPLDASFATSYRVDQLGGTDRLDAPEDGEIVPPPFKRYSESEFASWCKSMGDGMHKIMPIVMAKQREHAVHAMIEKSMTEGFGPPEGQPITEEQCRELARALAERYVKLLAHEGVFGESE
jgi:hypothetical protein